jgi:ribonuclease BN (tRNA processing enzyme)
MFALEALKARFGDALLLHWGTKADPKLAVIDGGPTGVFARSLRPRLERLREERQLADGDPLPIALMMVSHLDADHITGLLELISELKEVKDAKTDPLPWTVDRFWVNTFDDLIGNSDPLLTASTSSAGTASIGGLDLGGVLTAQATAILATVAQGRTLRDLLRPMQLDGNKPLKSLVMLDKKSKPLTIDGLELTVVGPEKKQLRKLQRDWDKKIKPLIKKKTDAAKAAVAEYLDTSVYNLSSIVVLVEHKGKSILLTGDARGDLTLDGLEQAGLLKEGSLHVDVLKLPHHGSDRDVDLDYFQKVTADHYVISADGTNDNPDVPTLELLSRARRDDDFTIHLTNPLDEFAKPKPAADIAEFLQKEKQAGRKYRVEQRDTTAPSIRIQLA